MINIADISNHLSNFTSHATTHANLEYASWVFDKAFRGNDIEAKKKELSLRRKELQRLVDLRNNTNDLSKKQEYQKKIDRVGRDISRLELQLGIGSVKVNTSNIHYDLVSIIFCLLDPIVWSGSTLYSKYSPRSKYSRSAVVYGLPPFITLTL
jgi:hypothetical protein